METAEGTAHPEPAANHGKPVHTYPPAAINAILELEKAGAHLLACRARDEPRPGAPDDPFKAKSPIGNDWQKPECALRGSILRSTLNDGRLVGVIPGSLGMAVADVDVGAKPAIRELVAHVGAPPVAVIETLRTDGYHLVYRSPHAYTPGGYKRGDPGGNRQWATSSGQGDLRANAGFIVAWDPIKLLDAYKTLANHPEVDLYALDTPALLKKRNSAKGNGAKANGKADEKPAQATREPRHKGKKSLVKLACDAMRTAEAGGRNNLLNKLAFGFGGAKIDTAPLREAALASGLSASSVDATLRSGYDSGAAGADHSALLNVLRSEGLVAGVAPGLMPSLGVGKTSAPRVRKIGAAELAGELVDQLRPFHAYENGVGWMVRSDKTHWREDPEGLGLARVVLERVIDERALDRVSISLGTGGVCRELRAPLTVPPESSWDANPDWVGIPTGKLLHLPTGHRVDAQPDNYVSRSLGVLPAPGDLTTWMDFIGELLPDDDGVSIDWFQRWLGYCLYGHIHRSALFVFLNGPGSTGKSTLLDTMRSLMTPKMGGRGYWNSIPEQALVDTGQNQHREWLARLEGVRLVTVSDMPAGAWRSGLLKSISAGDPIVANRMHKESRTFKPVFKLIFAANQKPVLRRADDGLRRRMVLVETRPVSTPDPLLREKLRASLPAIAGWVLEGARQYHRRGILPIPPALAAWGEDYAEDEDPYLAWWEEHVTLAIGEFVPTRQLELSYQRITGGKLRVASLMEWLRTRNGKGAELVRRSVKRIQVNGVTVQRRGLENIALVGDKSPHDSRDPDGRKGLM